MSGDKNCAICGKVFTPYHTTDKYCADCRRTNMNRLQRDYRKRKSLKIWRYNRDYYYKNRAEILRKKREAYKKENHDDEDMQNLREGV